MFAHTFSTRLAMACWLLLTLTVLGMSAAQAQVQDGALRAPAANCPALLNQSFKRLQDEAPGKYEFAPVLIARL